MSIFKPEYETYQDVKSTLAWWATPVWGLVVFATYFFVLLERHRAALLSLVPGLSEWVAQVGLVSALLLLGGVVAHFAAHVLEVHDHLYDRYVVKWRDRYAREKMIPFLLSPYQERLSREVMEAALAKPGKTLSKMFYPFAGDRDAKIKQNLIVRFYERITKYWLTQTVEVASLVLVAVTGGYGMTFYGPKDGKRAVSLILVAIAVIVINRIVAWRLRIGVWEATKAEIEDIHSSCKDEFESCLEQFCSEHGCAFKQTIITP
jgi:hypothetical protein